MVLRRKYWAWIFLSIPMFLYGLIVVGPTVYSFYFSLTDSNLLSDTHKFIGFENFKRLFKDSDFWQAFLNTGIWTFMGVLVALVLGFGLALGLSKVKFLSRTIKSIFFLPLALSLVVVGFIWFWIYRYDFGLINIILRFLGKDSLAKDWLADPTTALASIIVAWAWQQVSLSMIIFLAGLTAVPEELMEASQVDGAKWRTQVRHVIIPSMTPAMVVVISLALINALKTFDIVYVMTQGGPFGKTRTLSVLSYRAAFRSYDFGYSSAIAVVLFALTVTIIGGFMYLTRRGNRDD
jgi:multiple sugar transport system permease protein/raffinose/stachyose/melibiose transport system permease protein